MFATNYQKFNRGRLKRFLVILLSLLSISIISLDPFATVNAQNSNYPYAVPSLNGTVTFEFWGNQVPLSISLSVSETDPTVGTLTYQDHSQAFSRYIYQVDINSVETTPIQLTNYLGETRTINANTQLTLQVSTNQIAIPTSYLFVNSNGGLSLATTVPSYLTQTISSDQYFELTQMDGPIVTEDFDTSYAVAQSDWTNDFYFDHVNMPTKISVYYNDQTENQGTVTFESGQQTVTYQAVFETIPQVNFRMESTLSGVEPIRYIKANTRIRLSQPSNQSLPAELGDDLYLFYNKKGGISLATTRFTSNGLGTEYDLKAEAVAK
ncbi:hypothetical protein [Fundicoccus culcitae]|uniref:MucBP domain-containing protein n=1 Tax=Fundicoccus culcitae TaxID=2969821 RepID=A0ABY5P6V4_9LACT|nr:hypothetical protein [Fundicoccus culcitae]UUX34138.1 hypothetical protein NRE15_00260 [Fundicoccus culcitae]